MKIIIVNEYFSPVGGTEQYLIPVCQELEKNGHEIAVVYGEQTGREEFLKDRRYYLIPDILGHHSRKNKKGLERLEAVVKEEDPDIIYIHQVHNPFAIRVLIRNKPCIRYFHGFKILCPAGHHTLIKSDKICEISTSYRCLVRAYSERCMPRNIFKSGSLIRLGFANLRINMHIRKFIVASSYMKEMLIDAGLPEDRIEIISYYTRLPHAISEEENTSPVFDILFLGRLVKPKGLHFLIEALKYIDGQWQCTVIGEGPEFESIRNIAKKYQISERLHFTGWLPNEALGKYYRKARVVVVPSVWPEPFGIVGIEAMSYAKPVVAFDVGGISEWLEDGRNGFLVPRKDVKGLAQKIEVLLRDKDLARKFGEKGRETVENYFTKDIHIKRLMQVFEKVQKDDFSTAKYAVK
ncbi:MAG: glycosyltransferase family 4 protein [Candidatus Aminicenantaceae bacterium]